MTSVTRSGAAPAIVSDRARKLPQQQRSRHLVEAMLDATELVLARHGYDKVNTNLVATVAGVSIGSLYQYFPNKEALVGAVVERHGERLHAKIVRGFGAEPPVDLAEAVARIVASVAVAHQLDPKFHAVVEGEMPRRDGFDGHCATTGAIVGLLEALPEEMGVARGQSGAEPYVVAEMIHALIHAAMIPPASQKLRPGEIERETCRAVLGYLAASTD